MTTGHSTDHHLLKVEVKRSLAITLKQVPANFYVRLELKLWIIRILLPLPHRSLIGLQSRRKEKKVENLNLRSLKILAK